MCCEFQFLEKLEYVQICPHSTICNRLLEDRAEKLVYMYCNEKILSHIESNDYEEGMPTWVYDCREDDDDCDFNVGVPLCTTANIEENLTIDVVGNDQFAQREFREIEPLNDDNTNTTDDETNSIEIDL